MYTNEQKFIIEDRLTNLLLLASAGSGKTFTIANKIANEIKSGLKPEDVLCLTFTVKGAEELKEDVNKFCGESGIKIFTIHGFCYYIIKEYCKNNGGLKEPHIADEVDSGEILASILKSYAEDEEYELSDDIPLLPERQLGKIMTTIKHKRDEFGFSHSSEDGYGVTINWLFENSSSFNSLFSIKKSGVKVTDYSLITLLKKKGNDFCLLYQRTLRSASLMDFDDLIFASKELIYSNAYKKPMYKLIIVDEMQDTSLLEYQIAKAFFDCARVLMCGDPYQTIYSWRGSAPFEIIKDFKTNYNAVEVSLNGNRRSSPIITYSGRYYLAESFKGSISYPEQPTLTGEKIDVIKCYDNRDEAGWIFDYIKNYQGDRSGICVMARANRYLADLYKYFDGFNATLPQSERISFFTADSDFQFYKKPVIKDFLAFLRLAVNKNDGTAFTRIADKYISVINFNSVSAIKNFGAYGVSLSTFLNPDTYAYGDDCFRLISAYKSKKAVIYDLETTGLDLEKDEMIQISALNLGTGETFNKFVIPTCQISQKALSTHGYSLEYIKSHDGVSAQRALEEFAKFTKGCVLIGHNSSNFDDFILNRQAKSLGINLDTKGYYDTLTLASTVLPNLSDYKLSTCCKFFGVINERAHDAFADVEATAKCLEKLLVDYYIPMTDNRKRIIESKKQYFKSFYEKYLTIKELIDNGEVLKLIKFIDDTFGVLSKNPRKTDRESANDLYRALKPMEDSENPIFFLKNFLSDAALSGSQMDIVIKKYGKIPLITVHQSKGCEFDTVILAGAGENEFPSYGARLSGSEDEEKRIFFVALSRAKRKLILTYPSKKVFGINVYERLPSPYIAKLPKSCITETVTYK